MPIAATASNAQAVGAACSAAPGCVVVDIEVVLAVIVPLLKSVVWLVDVDVKVEVSGLVAIPVAEGLKGPKPELLPLDLVEIENLDE